MKDEERAAPTKAPPSTTPTNLSVDVYAGRGGLTRDAARQLTDEVKRHAETLWRKLVELYEGGAHTALGYASWHAYCEAEFQIGQSRAYQLLDAGRVSHLAHSTNGGTLNERQARELAPLLRDDEQQAVEVWRELQEKHGDKLTADKVRQAVTERLVFEQKVGALKSSKSVEWYTPATYISAAREVLGAIDLDPASSPEANATVNATTFYDAEQDGLTQPWRGRVWLNPPYGKPCASFIPKLLDEYDAGNVTASILLLSAYSTDSGWFQPLWDYLLCFTDHRIDFTSPLYDKSNNSTMGSVFVYIGPEPPRFARVFQRFGTVVEKSRLLEAVAA